VSPDALLLRARAQAPVDPTAGDAGGDGPGGARPDRRHRLEAMRTIKYLMLFRVSLSTLLFVAVVSAIWCSPVAIPLALLKLSSMTATPAPRSCAGPAGSPDLARTRSATGTARDPASRRPVRGPARGHLGWRAVGG